MSLDGEVDWRAPWLTKKQFFALVDVVPQNKPSGPQARGAALPWLTNLFSNLLFSFFLFMLPNKETNSSEESECDDLDPNTSMEVETIILVIIFSQEHVSVLKYLCCKGSWWICIARRRVCQFSVSHKMCQFRFCQALNWSLGFFCSGNSGGSSVTSTCWAGGSRSHPQSLFPTWDLIPTIMQVCQLLINVAPFYIKTPLALAIHTWAASQACVVNHGANVVVPQTALYLENQKRQHFLFLLAEWELHFCQGTEGEW